MATFLELATQLQTVRLQLKLREVETKIEKVKSIMDLTREEIGGKDETLLRIDLMRLLCEFVKLNETYADTLESACDLDDVSCIRAIQESIDIRDLRFKQAMKLFTELTRDPTSSTNK